MKHVLDTEFWDRGPSHPLQLISLGIASEDGRVYYAINKAFKWTKDVDPWLREHVQGNLDHPHIRGTRPLRSYEQMRTELDMYFKDDPNPEFWGYFADWDWLLFCHIWGGMLKTPKKFPHLCMDIEQERISLGFPKAIYPTQTSVEHNALNDALWSKGCLDTVLLYKQKLLDRVGVGTV